MNVQRGILPAIIIGGLAAASALFVNTRRRSAQPARREERRAARPRRRLQQAITVRVTENGRKYHRDNCPLLHGANHSVPIAKAIESYEPCKACHPPGWEA